MRNTGRTIVALITVLAACCLSAAPERGGAGDKAADKAGDKVGDKERIQGTWKYVSVLEQGREERMPEENRLVITADMLKMVYPGEERGFRYTIDPSKDPKEMDWIIEIDPGHPIRQLGIYSLEGDTLRICNTAAGKPRPTTFESKAGDFGGVWVLKRVAAPTSKRSGN